MKYALITGATGGIGKEVAKRLNKLGYKLVLVDIDSKRLKAMQENYCKSILIKLDMTDRATLGDFCNKITTGDFLPKNSNLAVGIINAGIVVPKYLTKTSPQEIDAQLDINLRSALHLIRALAIYMQKQNSGHILASVSMGGIISLKGSGIYSATKFGLRGFLTSLKDELKPNNIFVTGIYPSGVDTPMLRFEANNGGNVLNYLSHPLKVEKVGDIYEKALKKPKLDYYLPYFDSLTSRFIGAFPWLLGALYPLLEKIGERGRIKYIKSLEDKNS